MKIIFHPSYDCGYYKKLIGASKSIIGTNIVGTMGLLECLSLHNGLSGLFVSDGERASAYLSHVRTYAMGTMIENSFKNDALGVAKCLLRWRDLLIMAGWDSSLCGDGSTPKLQLLYQIEQSWKAQLKGNADRWHDLACLPKEQLLVEGVSIECRCPRENLPRLVLDVLERYGASFVDFQGAQLPETNNITVRHYNDLSDAYRQVAANMEEYKDMVIINRDNVSLNHILFSWGRSLLGASIPDSNPLTLQLFKLALSVFSRPLNVQNILSYLQLPDGPVPSKLRNDLANILIQEGGFGAIDWDGLKNDEKKAEAVKNAGLKTKWQLTIFDYINDESDIADKNESDRKSIKEQRKSKADPLRYITDNSICAGKNIPVDTIRKYTSVFTQWASAIAFNADNNDEMHKSQLATVVLYFKQLSDALNGVTDISYQNLEKLVRTIYQPTTIVQAYAQVGSLNVVNSYSQLLDSPEKLLWLDCCDSDECLDQYEFLSTAERNWLSKQTKVTIPNLKKILEANRKEMIMTLANISGEITLVTADYFHNKKMAEHPLIAELKMTMGTRLKIEEGPFSLPMTKNQNIKKLEPKLQYNLGKITYNGRSESNTSIDELINYPFDYVMHYLAKLKESSSNEMGSIQKVTGLVAHCFIEGLVTSAKDLPKNQRLDKMRYLLNNEYDKRFDESITITGLPLLLKENEVDYNNLKFQLKRSIEVLFEIMEQKNLTPVGCELKYDKELGKVINDFNARIDMVLEDSKDNTVIFDFKWSYAKYYGEKIKAGKAIQLELYRKELEAEGKKVSVVGYYLFPKCVLETPDYDTLKDKSNKVIIMHIDSPQNAGLFNQIENSIVQRRDELEKGNIEEGEGMDIKDLPYSTKLLSAGNMLTVGEIKMTGGPTKKEPNRPYNIESIKKESNKVFTNKPASRFSKAAQDFINENIPLNETPTTYQLMKGRLK